MKFVNLTVLIPAYNEEQRIGRTLNEISEYFENILVVDDNSVDKTKEIAIENGAKVINNQFTKGYLGAIKTGFRNISTDWVATIDADGEHRVEDLIRMCDYAMNSEYDVVIGTRSILEISRPSEIFLSLIAKIKSPIFDTGSGMRILKNWLAKEMELFGECPCGTFVLEAISLGAKIGGYPIKLNRISKSRKIAWYHWKQLHKVLKML